MSPACAAPIPFDALIAYHVGELPADEGERVEAHYFGCAHCAERLEVVSLLARGVVDLVHGGGLMVFSTMAMIERARAAGVVVREYRTDPGQHVQCTGGPADDFVVTRYGGLAGVTSVDLHFRGTILGTDQVIAMEYPDAPAGSAHGRRRARRAGRDEPQLAAAGDRGATDRPGRRRGPRAWAVPLPPPPLGHARRCRAGTPRRPLTARAGPPGDAASQPPPRLFSRKVGGARNVSSWALTSWVADQRTGAPGGLTRAGDPKAIFALLAPDIEWAVPEGALER